MKNSKEILEKHKSTTPSKWREVAEWRRENKQWLRKSQRIAVSIMNRMEERGLTQKTLAEMMKVTPQRVNKILKGSENLSLETISKFESALQTEILSVHLHEAESITTEVCYEPVSAYQAPPTEFDNISILNEVDKPIYISMTKSYSELRDKHPS